MKNNVFLHLLNSLKHGGGENVAYNYCIAANNIGIASNVVAKPYSVEYENQMRSVASVSYRISKDLYKSSDVIFIHSNINLIKVLFLQFLWGRRKKTVYLQHLYYSEFKFFLLSLIINFVCTDFIQITPRTNDLVVKYIRINVKKITNFYNRRYSNEEREDVRKEVRNHLGVRDDQILIAFSAALKPGKNLLDFISLAKSMSNDNDFLFIIIGDGEEAKYIKEYTGTNILWTGYVNDVEKYLIASDVYVFMSLNEMMPMALIEAIDAGKYIAAYKTSVTDFLLDNKAQQEITRNTILNYKQLPSGEELVHYDMAYAETIIRKYFAT